MKLEEKLKILDEMVNSYISTIGETINYGPIERAVAFEKAIDKTGCQCFVCGYSPCKKYKKEWDFLSEDEQKELRPHRIVHGMVRGLYTKDNVVSLCNGCHSEEYEFFKAWREKRPIPRESEEIINYFFNMFRAFVITKDKNSNLNIES